MDARKLRGTKSTCVGVESTCVGVDILLPRDPAVIVCRPTAVRGLTRGLGAGTDTADMRDDANVGTRSCTHAMICHACVHPVHMARSCTRAMLSPACAHPVHMARSCTHGMIYHAHVP